LESGSPFRQERLMCLGNAIVPQQLLPLMEFMAQDLRR
jgi:hypothetical protein